MAKSSDEPPTLTGRLPIALFLLGSDLSTERSAADLPGFLYRYSQFPLPLGSRASLLPRILLGRIGATT
jgi:hypothetical protein